MHAAHASADSRASQVSSPVCHALMSCMMLSQAKGDDGLESNIVDDGLITCALSDISCHCRFDDELKTSRDAEIGNTNDKLPSKRSKSRSGLTHCMLSSAVSGDMPAFGAIQNVPSLHIYLLDSTSP